MNNNIIARKTADGRMQNLDDHLKSVAHISSFNSLCPNISKLIAQLHDIGKLSDQFQVYIKDGGERGSVVHAWQGVFLANELFDDLSSEATLLKEVIAFSVTGHHNYISDGLSTDGSTNYYDKLLNTMDIKYSYDCIKNKVQEEDKIELINLFIEAKQEINILIENIRKIYSSKNSANFALGLFTKYIYSSLIDADRLDAYLFDLNEKYRIKKFDWDEIIDTFEHNLLKFSSDNQINRIRKEISDRCKAAAAKESGIYQLLVPTGGGKTLSSLRFALHHCKKHNKKRIIYVIPYLSIIEQTAKSIRENLNMDVNDEFVFEHHSNIIEPDDEKSAEIRKLTASRWDNPIIITSVVQFLDTVMSSKAGKLRKFSHMADSVIIFDEVQSIPTKTIHCFNEVVTFISKILNATVILCSATQPTFESTQRKNLLLNENPKLIEITAELNNLKRVKIINESPKSLQGATDFILDKAYENGNCLVIVNTKKSALEIYKSIKSQIIGFEIFHLSTSMCPEHRIKVIESIKKGLDVNKKIVCISTQLVEAGVDISFSCVIRAMAGLDSIAQASGRCNRNCESSETKAVYTFALSDENIDKLPDIKSGKEIAESIIQNRNSDVDLLEESIMNLYYQNYFKNKGSQMDYPLKGSETIYAMLSNNEYGRGNYHNKTGNIFPHIISHAFHTADMNFNVIDEKTKSVVVFYGDAEELIIKYRQQPVNIFTKEKAKILKKLQRYSVELYDWQLQELSKNQALSILDEQTGIIILDKNYYSEDDVGVVLEIIQDNLIVGG